MKVRAGLVSGIFNINRHKVPRVKLIGGCKLRKKKQEIRDKKESSRNGTAIRNKASNSAS